MSFRGQKKPFTVEEISVIQRNAEHLAKRFEQMDLYAQEAVDEASDLIFYGKPPPQKGVTTSGLGEQTPAWIVAAIKAAGLL